MRKNQQVICTNEFNYWNSTTLSLLERLGLIKPKKLSGPKFNEVVTVLEVEGDYLKLLGYTEDSYHKEGFAEIMSTYELESELNEIFQKEPK